MMMLANWRGSSICVSIMERSGRQLITSLIVITEVPWWHQAWWQLSAKWAKRAKLDDGRPARGSVWSQCNAIMFVAGLKNKNWSRKSRGRQQLSFDICMGIWDGCSTVVCGAKSGWIGKFKTEKQQMERGRTNQQLGHLHGNGLRQKSDVAP